MMSMICHVAKKGKRKVQGVPQSQTAALPKGDCKVQTLAIEIITLLNECMGRLSRVSTRHKHNRSGIQKKKKKKKKR